MPTYQRTFPGLPEAVRNARRWTRKVLHSSSLLDDAALIVTELGANALLHTTSGDTNGTFHVALTLSDETVTIAVTDHGGTKTEPTVERPAQDDPHGRGLRIVTTLAHQVRVTGDEHGRTVTAHLDHDDHPRSAR